jgi:hypothetical protein
MRMMKNDQVVCYYSNTRHALSRPPPPLWSIVNKNLLSLSFSLRPSLSLSHSNFQQNVWRRKQSEKSEKGGKGRKVKREKGGNVYKGFRVQGLGYNVWGVGCRVEGVRVQILGFRV